MNKLNHVAIIMDGNGRWGLKKDKSRNYGHLHGIKRVEEIVKSATKKKIPYLTLYTFSTENWRRPASEINFLFDLIRNSLKKKLNKIVNNGIKVKIIGNKRGLPKDILRTIKLIEKKTNRNVAITLNLALNYGSKEEIISACKKISKSKKNKINEKNFASSLYTKNIPDPEIMIRTGGARRLSNFLLWQLAYTEIFFLNKLWPDFNSNDFESIISKYDKIKRNFGKI
jgi:undecaprenyl diphosphate synthase